MGNKYVVETGPGYLGIYRVSNKKTCISIGSSSLEWEIGDRVVATPAQEGVRVKREGADCETLSTATVKNEGHGPNICLSGGGLRHLGVDNGDDIRVYRHDSGGLHVVPAADDPHVGGDA